MPHAGIRPLSGSFHLESQYGAESKTPSLPGASGCGKSARRIARFLSPDEEQISLSGNWKYQVSLDMREVAPMPVDMSWIQILLLLI